LLGTATAATLALYGFDQIRQAREQRTRAELLAYAGQIALAQRECEDNKMQAALELLDACPRDFRGWGHHYLYTLCMGNQQLFRGHTGEVHSVCFSPDGTRLASASGSWDAQHEPSPGEVKVWDVQRGTEVLSLRDHTGPVYSICFSPDGKRIASGGGNPNQG